MIAGKNQSQSVDFGQPVLKDFKENNSASWTQTLTDLASDYESVQLEDIRHV